LAKRRNIESKIRCDKECFYNCDYLYNTISVVSNRKLRGSPAHSIIEVDMGTVDDLTKIVGDSLKTPWNSRDGQVVPETEAVALSDGAVKLAATMLYTDLADSTDLAMWDRRVAARVCKSFLECSTRLIRARGGSVRSFDGDRVMGVCTAPLK
jgi:class 3 adenylate cyclase